MKPIDVKNNAYINTDKEVNYKILNFKFVIMQNIKIQKNCC